MEAFHVFQFSKLNYTLFFHVFLQILLSFFSWYSDHADLTTFDTVPHFLDVLFYIIILFFFLLVFQFGTLLLTYLKVHWYFFSSFASGLLMSLSKTFFISVTLFFTSSHCFWFFLVVLISMLTFPTCFCVLSTFSIRSSVGIPKATSDLMIHQKDTQVLEKLMYAWLLFNTVKQYRLNQQRERAHEEKCRSNQEQASRCPLPVQLHRHI